MSNDYSRRAFLKQAMLASAAAAVAPGILSAMPKLAGPNERVNLACIGIGNRGAQIIGDLYATGLANIVALCDVDMGAPHTVKILEKFPDRSEEHTSELQSLMRISYAVYCLENKKLFA